MIYQLELTREGRTAIRAHERIDRPVEPRVHYQVFLLGKTLSTIFTHVRTLSGVELAVRNQMALQRERTATLLTDEGALPAVDARVRQQVMLQREALLALLALVRTIGRVQQQMGVQAVLVGKIFATVDAHVRSFTGVNPGVGCKVVLQQKGFSALVARIGTLLGDHVRRRCVRLLLDVLIVVNLYCFQLGRDAQRGFDLELVCRGGGLRVFALLEALDHFLDLDGDGSMVPVGVGGDGVLIVCRNGRRRSLHQDVVAFLGRQLDRPQRGHEGRRRGRTATGRGGQDFRLRVDDSVR